MKRIPIDQLEPETFVVRAEGAARFKLKPGLATREKIHLLRSKGVTSVVVCEREEYESHRLFEDLQRAKRLTEDMNRSMRSVADSVRAGGVVPLGVIEDMTNALFLELSVSRNTLLYAINLKNKDEYTYEHSVRVGIYSLVMAISLAKDEKELTEFGTAGMLHDVGKLALPSGILQKRTSLSPFEKRLVQEHPAAGRKILSGQPDISRSIRLAVEQHHERMDGRGYSQGLKGDQISLLGRVLAIVDTYDAITSDRPYKKARSSYAAFSEMRSRSGLDYDIDLLDRFIKHIGIYAPGTIVQLNNGEYASVIENSSSNLLEPKVFVHDEQLVQRDSRATHHFKSVNLIKSGFKITKVLEPEDKPYSAQKAISLSVLATAGGLSG